MDREKYLKNDFFSDQGTVWLIRDIWKGQKVREKSGNLKLNLSDDSLQKIHILLHVFCLRRKDYCHTHKYDLFWVLFFKKRSSSQGDPSREYP